MKAKMKRIVTLFLVFALVLLSGCNAKDGQNGTNQSDDTSHVENTDDSSSKEVFKEYIFVSEQCASQMGEGDFTDTYELFSETMKDQLSKETLQNAWDQTVADIGEYQGVYQSSVSGEEGAVVVKTILRYAESGLIVTFSYESVSSMTGIWINYYTIPADAANTDKYEEIEISIGEYELDGRLMLPKNVDSPPVVILIQGSGQSDMNETIGENSNQLFYDIAVGLAQKGIATIRFNKRFYQFPELATDDITIEDEVTDDVDSAISYAQECGKVNPDQIYLLGHSMGGMLVPAIAASHSEIAGIISMAGSPRNLIEIIYDQNVDVLNRSDLTQETMDQQISLLQNMVDTVMNLTGDENTTIAGISSVYWYSLNQLQADKYVANLTIPMLFLQGEADFQVYANRDFVMWQDLLEGKDNCIFHLYPDLNHLFMATNGKTDITEYDVKGTVNDQVITDIADWILE